LKNQYFKEVNLSFLDKLSKTCTWLYLPWLLSLIIFPEFRHALVNILETPWFLAGLIILSFIGNIVPGIPTNPFPILAGLEFAFVPQKWTSPIASAIAAIFLIVLLATLGSLTAFRIARGAHGMPNYIFQSVLTPIY